MGKQGRVPGVFLNILLAVGLVATWIAFAPVKLGGQVSYVLVDGISMLPTFHTGDLVLVRKAPTYQVGDVVSYQDALMGAAIIHRIIDVQGDHFLLKGDNNLWIDEYQPSSTEIFGKEWIFLPKFGEAVLWIRSPANMALAVGILGGLMMANLTIFKKKNGKLRNLPAVDPAGFEIALYGCGILAFVFLVLVIISYTRPMTTNADKISYKQTGVFSYTAAGDPGVYDTGSARSGEPIFTNLTCTLNLDFIYMLQGDQLENISGTQQFEAEVLDQQSGWNRTIPLTTLTEFKGPTFTSQTAVNLCQVQALVASIGLKTGFHLSSYSLIIFPTVSVGGTISGQKFSDTFKPRLTFSFDNLHFFLSKGTSTANPLETDQAGSVLSSGEVDNSFQLFGLSLSVRWVRIISWIGLDYSLGGLLALGLYYYFVSRRKVETIIHMKYAALLMDVQDQGLAHRTPVIDVNSIDDLARLAERQNVMIMHMMRQDDHIYFVQVEGTTYRFNAGKDLVSDSDNIPEEPGVERRLK